jgi:hypothetical protein
MASVARGDVGDTGREEGDKTPAARAEPNYSGRLLLRMPRALHAELAQRAEREGTSLNQLIIGALSSSVHGDPKSVPDAASADDAVHGEPARREPRLLTFALALNLIVIVVAGAIAVGLLVAAWQGGL